MRRKINQVSALLQHARTPPLVVSTRPRSLFSSLPSRSCRLQYFCSSRIERQDPFTERSSHQVPVVYRKVHSRNFDRSHPNITVHRCCFSPLLLSLQLTPLFLLTLRMQPNCINALTPQILGTDRKHDVRPPNCIAAWPYLSRYQPVCTVILAERNDEGKLGCNAPRLDWTGTVQYSTKPVQDGTWLDCGDARSRVCQREREKKTLKKFGALLWCEGRSLFENLCCGLVAWYLGDLLVIREGRIPDSEKESQMMKLVLVIWHCFALGLLLRVFRSNSSFECLHPTLLECIQDKHHIR